MGRRTPQEKKALSYAKDGRNVYGENDKASRKNLPRKRARVHRANRHQERQVLHEAVGSVDDDYAEDVQDRLQGRRLKRFRKGPDMPLGEYLRSKRSKRDA